MDISGQGTKTSDIINYSKTNELLEDIFKFKADRQFEGEMIELIISYCDENEYRIEEVGDILSDSKDFMKMFEKSLIRGNHIQVEKTDNDEIQMDDEEW